MTIHFSRPSPHVALIELDRPPANTLGAAMRRRLTAGLDAIEDDLDVRVVVLTGRGRQFCAGNDLRELADRAPDDLSPIDDFNVLVDRVEGLRPPTIAAVGGGALGGGLDLALACDIRLAAEGATFTASGVNVGLMASAGRLPGLIGLGPAKAMLLTGLPVDAPTALRTGLVTAVHPAGALLDEAMALAGRIAARAPLAVEAAKRLAGRPGEEARATLTALAASADHREAVTAFLEKRTPAFSRR
ncbi:MAG: enoyl-CoA hydratase/isomerase family protein [Pseudomonadota bacterium]